MPVKASRSKRGASAVPPSEHKVHQVGVEPTESVVSKTTGFASLPTDALKVPLEGFEPTLSKV